MKPELVALVAAIVSGTLTLLGVWVSTLMANRRERIAFMRTLGRERVDTLRSTFEHGLVVLERHVRNVGMISSSDVADMQHAKARLALCDSPAVSQQFETTARALDEWAAAARQGTPWPGPNGVVAFVSGYREAEHNEYEGQLWLEFSEQRGWLLQIMRA